MSHFIFFPPQAHAAKTHNTALWLVVIAVRRSVRNSTVSARVPKAARDAIVEAVDGLYEAAIEEGNTNLWHMTMKILQHMELLEGKDTLYGGNYSCPLTALKGAIEGVYLYKDGAITGEKPLGILERKDALEWIPSPNPKEEL